MKSWPSCVVFFCLVGAGCIGQAAEVSADAARLIATVDAMDVQHHWPAGEHVDWQTDFPDGKPEQAEGKHTHCSAFVAAAAKRLGV